MTKIVASSGNVFADLGFSPSKARALMLRSKLLLWISQVLQAQRKSQRELARQLGLHQSQVSELLNHKAGQFSLDALVGIATSLGLDVDLTESTAPNVNPPTRAFAGEPQNRVFISVAYSKESNEPVGRLVAVPVVDDSNAFEPVFRVQFGSAIEKVQAQTFSLTEALISHRGSETRRMPTAMATA